MKIPEADKLLLVQHAKRIRQQVKTDDMRLGFTQNKSTTDEMFIVRQFKWNLELRIGRFVTYCWPGKGIWWSTKRSGQVGSAEAGAVEWLVEMTMAMYKGVQTAVRTEHCLTGWFKILVGLHQRSHKRYTGIRGSLTNDQNIDCRICKLGGFKHGVWKC